MKLSCLPLSLVFLVAPLLLAQEQQPPNPTTAPAVTHKMSSKEKRNTATAHGATVDLNTASKEDIAALPGVGPDYAQKIIDGRPYSSKQDLMKKKILPQWTYDNIENNITASAPGR